MLVKLWVPELLEKDFRALSEFFEMYWFGVSEREKVQQNSHSPWEPWESFIHLYEPNSVSLKKKKKKEANQQID